MCVCVCVLYTIPLSLKYHALFLREENILRLLQALRAHKGMYACGPLHMAEQKQGDQLEHTYNISV